MPETHFQRDESLWVVWYNKICVYFAKGFWTDIRETNFIIMFNFILRNIVLSVPIVNSTKFIVLFLFSLGSLLFKKKKKKAKIFSVLSEWLKMLLVSFAWTIKLAFNLSNAVLCYALPMSLPCWETFCGSLLRTEFFLLILKTLHDINSINFLNIWMYTIQTRLFHVSWTCSRFLSSVYLLVLFPFLAMPSASSLLSCHFPIKVHISCYWLYEIFLVQEIQNKVPCLVGLAFWLRIGLQTISKSIKFKNT